MLSLAGVALGPVLVGFVLDTILYGVLVTQSLVYFSCYKSDARWLKLFVASLLALDTINVALEFGYIYNTLIIHFGDGNGLWVANWVFSTIPGTTGITSALVQLFFAWRIKVLKQSRLVLTGIVFLTLVGMLCGIGTTIAVNLVPTFTQFHRFEPIVIIWLSACAVANLLIAVSLVLSLREFRTGFADTDHIIKRIIRLTLHTGLLTAMWAIMELSVYIALNDGMHLVFLLPLAKFYSNSLLSTLISRTREPDPALDFTVVDVSRHVECRQENILTFHSTEQIRSRNTEIVFETISVKKLHDQMSIAREDYEHQ